MPGPTVILPGATDVSVVIQIVDSGDGTPETGVLFNTGGIDIWYRRDGEVSVDITEAVLATPALTDAHLDGGFLHINDGSYRLDLPDAACATGVAGVQIGGTVTGMVVYGPYIQLESFPVVAAGPTKAEMDAAHGLLATLAAQAIIDGNVDDTLIDTGAMQPTIAKLDAAQTEPTGVPAANETPLDKIGYLFMVTRNKVTVTSSKKTYFGDDDVAEFEKDLSDDATTYAETKINAI